jgi:hypothetical protein
MSQSVRDFKKSFTADNAIVQYSVVKVTTTGASTCDTATANGDAMIGIAQNGPSAAEQCTVRMFGTSKCLAGGTITAGQTVTATTAGKVVADSTDTHGIIGRALESAVTGDTFEVLIQPYVI